MIALPRTAVPIIKLQTASVPTSFGAMAVISMDVSFIFDTSSDMDHQMLPSNQNMNMLPPLQQSSINMNNMPFSSFVPNSHWLSSSSSSQKLASYDSQIKHHQHYDSSDQQHPQHQPLQPPPMWQHQQGQQLQPLPQQQPMFNNYNNLPLQQQPQHMGVENTRFVSRLCALHPPLTALVLVLKQLLHEKGLNDPFKGGLGAYGLTVMAAAVCQVYCCVYIYMCDT